MSIRFERARVQYFIVLVGFIFISSSHAQELMDLSLSATTVPQVVVERQLNLALILPATDVNVLGTLLTLGVLPAANAPQAVADLAGTAIDIAPPVGLEHIRQHTARARNDDLLSPLLRQGTFDFVIAGFSCSEVERLRQTHPRGQD